MTPLTLDGLNQSWNGTTALTTRYHDFTPKPEVLQGRICAKSCGKHQLEQVLAESAKHVLLQIVFSEAFTGHWPAPPHCSRSLKILRTHSTSFLRAGASTTRSEIKFLHSLLSGPLAGHSL